MGGQDGARDIVNFFSSARVCESKVGSCSFMGSYLLGEHGVVPTDRGALIRFFGCLHVFLLTLRAAFGLGCLRPLVKRATAPIPRYRYNIPRLVSHVSRHGRRVLPCACLQALRQMSVVERITNALPVHSGRVHGTSRACDLP